MSKIELLLFFNTFITVNFAKTFLLKCSNTSLSNTLRHAFLSLSLLLCHCYSAVSIPPPPLFLYGAPSPLLFLYGTASPSPVLFPHSKAAAAAHRTPIFLCGQVTLNVCCLRCNSLIGAIHLLFFNIFSLPLRYFPLT